MLSVAGQPGMPVEGPDLGRPGATEECAQLLCLTRLFSGLRDSAACSQVAGNVATTRRANHRTTHRTEKKAPLCRAFPCAEEDSNLHPVNPDQALNLARLPIPPSARASGQYRARVGAVDLCPSTARATVHEHMFDWLPTKRGLAWT